MAALEGIQCFIGEIARPFAIISTSGAAAIAVVTIAQRVMDGSSGAVFIGAVFVGVGALYGAKAWETSVQAKQDASVKIAQAGTGSGSGQ